MVEVIISIAILSLASVVVLRLFVTSVDLNTRSRHSDIASVMATNYLEQIKAHEDPLAMLEAMDELEETEQGYTATRYMTENFEVSDSQNTAYTLTCQIELTDTPGLYNLVVSVIDEGDQSELIRYRTAHYFKGEVSLHE